ncbi:hypothetical protein HYU19_00705 [Candidatus Woesearchaeota archaeon]|nr:hypothetical protein [Candidatus Woesearchaeota archaeon]
MARDPAIPFGTNYEIDPSAYYKLEDIVRVVEPPYQKAAHFLSLSELLKKEERGPNDGIPGWFLQKVKADLASRLVTLSGFYETFRSTCGLTEEELPYQKFYRIAEQEGVKDIYLVEVKSRNKKRRACYLLKPGKTKEGLMKEMWKAYERFTIKDVMKRSTEPMDRFLSPDDLLAHMRELESEGTTVVLFLLNRFKDKGRRAQIDALRRMYPYVFMHGGATELLAAEKDGLEYAVRRFTDVMIREGDMQAWGRQILTSVQSYIQSTYGFQLQELEVGIQRAGRPSRLERRVTEEAIDPDDDDDDATEADGLDDEEDDSDKDNEDDDDDTENGGDAGKEGARGSGIDSLHHPLDHVPAQEAAGQAQNASLNAPVKRDGETEEQRRARLRKKAEKLAWMRGGRR